MASKKVSISLPPNVAEALIRRALKDNLPISAIVTQALKLYLKNHDV
jgi:hypothetical protein